MRISKNGKTAFDVKFFFFLCKRKFDQIDRIKVYRISKVYKGFAISDFSVYIVFGFPKKNSSQKHLFTPSYKPKECKKQNN